jgi:hypothetical protein
MRKAFRWVQKLRSGTSLGLLPKYFKELATRWQGILWGGSVFAIWGLYFIIGSPPSWLNWTAVTVALFGAGYFAWRVDHIRLLPKFTVPEQIKYHPTPTRDGDGVVNGMSVWVQLSPKCLTDAPVEQCSAWLREVRRWSEAEQKWKATDMNESLPLGWSFGGEGHPPITLEPGNERRLNVLSIHSSNKLPVPVTCPLPLLWTQSVYNDKDTFLFDITFRGKDCPPVDIYLTVRCGDQWDRPVVAFIQKPGASTLSS